ncbi:MFS general substrate transporter [Jackrogersella minutella]|nr:MFS general substrate transporter [Jackrogersella minutella]
MVHLGGQLSPSPITLREIAAESRGTRHPQDRATSDPEIVVTRPDNDGGSLHSRRRHASDRQQDHQPPEEENRILIRPSDCGDQLGFKWPVQKKWYCLWVIFFVQVSMNLNTTLYSNGIAGISREFETTPYSVRWGGASTFLIAYAFGCELWAPWSEEYGRRPVLQLSLGLVNCFAIVVLATQGWVGHVLGRTLGGLSSAGGSVTLAVISDIFEPDDPLVQTATSFIVLSSVGGSIIGPIVGGFLEQNLSWKWCIGIQLIVGALVQLIHLLVVPETRVTIIMDNVAKEYRKSGSNRHIYGPNEISGRKRITTRELGQIWMRPFRMFLTEPIVLVFSLLSGFSDAIIFMMVQSFSFVYWQWGFSTIQTGLSFAPIGIGYLIGFGMFIPFNRRNVNLRSKHPGSEYAEYESRLLPLLWTAPLLPIGLLVFAFTAAYFTTPIHWFPSMIGSLLIGVANFCIYMATIDYVLRAYGPYAASATGGNGWARDFLAGILTPYAIPMYVHRFRLTRYPCPYTPFVPLLVLPPMYEKLSVFMATIVLFAIGTFLCGAVFFVYKCGPYLRRHSKFAQTLAQAEADQAVPGAGEVGNDNQNGDLPNVDRMVNFLPSESLAGSRSNLHLPLASNANTPATTPRSSTQIERPPNTRHQSYQTQRVRLSQEITPIPEEPVRPTTSSSRTCTCSSGGKTLVGTCSRCKTSEGARTGENSAPTSLREVENAQLQSGVELDEDVVADQSVVRNTDANAPERFDEKGHHHRCSVM